MLDLIVVGGGISGLSVAWRAHQAGLDFRLLESTSQVGGVIHSESHREGVVEHGPDALVLSQDAVRKLLRELNLLDHAAPPSSCVPWMARDRKLSPLPEGFRQIAPTRWLPFAMTPLLSWWGKLRVLADLVLPASRAEDQTLAQLVSRRMGQEVLDQLAQPLIAGIYAADPKELSLAATMPHLLQLEKAHGSLLRGFWKSRAQAPAMASLPQGLGQLTSALGQRVAAQTNLSTPVLAINRLESGTGWSVETPGQTWQCRRLVVTTPAPHCARLLQPVDEATAQLIKGIHCRSVAILNQFYFSEQLGLDLPRCQGFLLPLREGTSFSAVSLAHKKWPDRTSPGYVNLRIHLGGAGREDFLGQDDDTLVARVTQEIQPWLGLRGQPLKSSLTRHTQCLPEYRLGHKARIQQILAGVARWPGLQVTGNWFSGVGIGECIARAEALSSQWNQQETLCNA
jgi:oxygen-dependent protoporphyrinogen oxidase